MRAVGLDGAFVAFHAVGTLLWIEVVYALLPRRTWAVATGTSLTVGLATIALVGRPGALVSAGVGAALGALLATVGFVLRRRRGEEAGGRASAVGRLWRGELPAWMAALALLGWLGAVLWTAAVVDAVPLYRFPRAVGLWYVAAWVTWPLGVAVALVGLWRSGSVNAPRPLWRPLGWLVKLAAAAAATLCAVVTAAIAPDQLADYAPLALDASERSAFTVRVLRGGAELELSGTLGFGVTEDVEAALDRNPGVGLLHLDSPGGRVVEGTRLADLVRRRKLGTYVANDCASACVTVFAAGEPRLLSRHAQVGLHAPARHFDTSIGRRRSAAQFAEALVSFGVDPSFAERGAATPNETLWRPTHDEILQARLASRHARWGEVALSGLTGEGDLDRLPLMLRERSFFQALYEFERPAFDRWAAAMRGGYERGESAPEALLPVMPELRAILGRIVGSDLPRASNRAVRAFFAATLDLLRRPGADGRRCSTFLKGRGAAARADGFTDGDDALMDAYAEVIASARLAPVTIPQPVDRDPLLLAAMARVEERQPGALALFAEIGSALESSPDAACSGILLLYEELLRLPEGDGARILRWMATNAP
jgi:hypothetical protein